MLIRTLTRAIPNESGAARGHQFTGDILDAGRGDFCGFCSIKHPAGRQTGTGVPEGTDSSRQPVTKMDHAKNKTITHQDSRASEVVTLAEVKRLLARPKGDSHRIFGLRAST
jgi:hypothetical protein